MIRELIEEDIQYCGTVLQVINGSKHTPGLVIGGFNPSGMDPGSRIAIVMEDNIAEVNWKSVSLPRSG